MINDLLLISGNDIPFEEAQIIVHQPTLKEIAYIGEDALFQGCELLRFSKNILSEQDRNNYSNYNDFDILMSIILNSTKENAFIINSAKLVLQLLFPYYEIKFNNKEIALFQGDNKFSINDSNFNIFKEILNTIFCLKEASSKEDYNPVGEMSSQIAKKLEKRHQKLAQLKGNNSKQGKLSIYSRYMSILSIALQINIKDLLNCTIYQILDMFNRYSLKNGYDIYVQAKMAGASDLKEPEDWMKNIHE